MVKLKAKIIDLEVGKRMVLLHEKDAQGNGILAHDWVKIISGKRKAVTFVDTTKSYLKQGEIGIFRDVYEEFKVKEGANISLSAAKPPESIKESVPNCPPLKGIYRVRDCLPKKPAAVR